MDKKHHVIIYVLIIALAAWLLYTTIAFSQSKDNQGTWKCSNVTCTQSIDGAMWAEQNCFPAPAANGSQDTICKVPTNNGQFQLIPLANLTETLAQYKQCTDYACSEEANVRPANYVYNPNGTKLFFSNTVVLGASQTAQQ